MNALDEAHGDDRVRRALDEENAYWQTAETRARAITNRVYLGRIQRVRRDPGLSWGGQLDRMSP